MKGLCLPEVQAQPATVVIGQDLDSYLGRDLYSIQQSFIVDNYQQTIKKRNQTGKHLALMHKATASSVVRNKVPVSLIGSLVIFPTSILFKVTSWQRETPYLLIITLE